MNNSIGYTEFFLFSVMLVLMAFLLAIALFVDIWVLVGSGIVFLCLWISVRLQTGVWVDSFSDIEIRLFPSRELPGEVGSRGSGSRELHQRRDIPPGHHL